MFQKETDLEYIYDALKMIANIKAYKKDEIPKGLNYKYNVRVGDIVIVAKIGYAVFINKQPVDWSLNSLVLQFLLNHLF